jgi:hypothetical protein
MVGVAWGVAVEAGETVTVAVAVNDGVTVMDG